jgi:hypothetical protein
VGLFVVEGNDEPAVCAKSVGRKPSATVAAARSYELSSSLPSSDDPDDRLWTGFLAKAGDLSLKGSIATAARLASDGRRCGDDGQRGRRSGAAQNEAAPRGRKWHLSASSPDRPCWNLESAGREEKNRQERAR